MPMEMAAAGGAHREREQGARTRSESDARSLREMSARIWSLWFGCVGVRLGFEFGGFGGKDEKAVAAEEILEIRLCPAGAIS